MKGTTIMFIGSWILLVLCLNLLRKLVLPVCITFIVIELVLAFYVTFKKKKVMDDGK